MACKLVFFLCAEAWLNTRNWPTRLTHWHINDWPVREL